MCEQFVKIINSCQYLVISEETEMGKLCGVIKNVNKSLYDNDILVNV